MGALHLYIWKPGDGNDVINEGSARSDDTDTLRLGVAPGAIGLSRVKGDDLLITIGGETILIQDQFKRDWAGIERIEFADGSFWTSEDIIDRIWQIGSNKGETLQGRDHWDDQINGLGGNDKIEGGSGDDLLIGGAGADVLDGGNGVDTVSYETAGGSVQVDLGRGAAQNGIGSDAFGDKLIKIEGLIGSNFNDTLKGDAESNQIAGLGGNDNISGLDGYDQLSGGAGQDSLFGGLGSDELDGGEGHDWVQGDEGDDSLLGGNGADTLIGGVGRDVLAGGQGGDRLSGGAGDDIFVFANWNGADVVTDFVRGEKIDLSQVDGLNDFGDLSGRLIQLGSSVLLTLSPGNTVLFEAANLNSFTEQTFIFA